MIQSREGIPRFWSNRKIVSSNFDDRFSTIEPSRIARWINFRNLAVHPWRDEESISRYLGQFRLRERNQSDHCFFRRDRSLNKKIPRKNGSRRIFTTSFVSGLSRGRNNFSIVTSVAGNSFSLSRSPDPSSSSPALCRKIGGSVMNGHWTAGANRTTVFGEDVKYVFDGIVLRHRGLFQSDEHNGITRCTALFLSLHHISLLVQDNNLDSLGGVN